MHNIAILNEDFILYDRLLRKAILQVINNKISSPNESNVIIIVHKSDLKFDILFLVESFHKRNITKSFGGKTKSFSASFIIEEYN